MGNVVSINVKLEQKINRLISSIPEDVAVKIAAKARTLSPYVSDKAVEDFKRVCDATELAGDVEG